MLARRKEVLLTIARLLSESLYLEALSEGRRRGLADLEARRGEEGDWHARFTD
jgi:hypothetical protein